MLFLFVCFLSFDFSSFICFALFGFIFNVFIFVLIVLTFLNLVFGVLVSFECIVLVYIYIHAFLDVLFKIVCFVC